MARNNLKSQNHATEKLRIEEAYEKATLALKKKYNQEGSQEDKNALREILCKSNAEASLLGYAEAKPSLSNQAQEDYQRLMNNKSPKNKRK